MSKTLWRLYYRFLFLLTVMVICYTVQAETQRLILSGVVKSTDKSPVDFATVYLKNTKFGCTTNEKGEYILNAPAGQYTFDVTVTFTKVVASGAFGSARSDVDTYTAPITLTVSGDTNATWITDVEIDDNGDLILTWSDGYIENVGHVVGSDGQDGLPGADGQDGTDGISVTSATVNDEGELVLTLSNGQQINAGHVVGADGQDGAPGANGTNGTNGANGADGQDASSATGIAAIAVSCVAAVISVAGIAMLVLARKKANK